jgi:3-dehydroquinate dehydratase / shikimate dehydrogenase
LDLDGGITPSLKGRLHWPESTIPGSQTSLFSLTVEEAFFMSTSLLCVTVAAGTMDELRQQRDRVAGADLVELRLDYVDRPDVAGALAGRRTPVIVTCRSQREGGRYSGSESERKALLASALQLGAEYVDLEFSAAFDDLIHAHHGKRIVLSMHDFDAVPADLTERVRAMRRVGAEVVKVAVHARTLSDSLALLKLKDPATRSVFIGMGPCGLPSRVLAAHFGSAWSYAGDGHAPGQIPIRQLIDDFGFRRINQDTAVYGLAGWPLEHSISPVMHNAALAEARLNAV